MHKILGKWRLIGIIIGSLKILAIFLIPVLPTSDFMNWVHGAKNVLIFLSAGQAPHLSTFGAYLGIDIVLVPFFWVWTVLPIQHPALHDMVNYTAPTVSLLFLMKMPIFLSDTLVGILLSRLVGKIAESDRRRGIAFLAWYANPYNIYWLYAYGAMDAIPASIVLLALILVVSRRWARSGFAIAIGSLMRIYPFFVLPFLLPLTNTKATRLRFIAGFMLPLVCVICVAYATATGTIANILTVAFNEPWLFDFLGGREHSWTTAGGQILILTPVLMLTQFYLVLRFWRHDSNIVHLASVSLLALSLGATIYAGSSQHFIWVSSLLSASLALHPEETWIFALTFVTAYLSPAVYPFNLSMFNPARLVVDNFLAGAFYSMKAIYLLRVNLSNIRSLHTFNSPPLAAQSLQTQNTSA